MKIFVAGHAGLVGSAIVRALKKDGYLNILTASRKEVDLTDQHQVQAFFKTEKPEVVFLAAAKVGGIQANNTNPADFIYENLMIQANVIHAAYSVGVKRLIFLGSSCIYPKHCLQPIKEVFLLTGPLEPTNQAYAVAKIAGVEMCYAYNRQYRTNFLPLMPTNLYGPNDNYDLINSHVLPAILHKAHVAKELGLKEIVLWGTGEVYREFLYVDDLADACMFFLKMSDEQYQKLFDKYDGRPLFNVGSGKDITIKALATMVCDIVGFDGVIRWDDTKPNGTPRKLLDISRIKQLGWQSKTSIEDGIRITYEAFKSEKEAVLCS